MGNDLNKVGNRIREARKKKKLSQAELSELLNISPSHMSDIENGKTNIGLDIFMRLTEVLQVSADWLLQTDVPEVNAILTVEVSNVMADCSPSEVQHLIRIMKEIKAVLKETKKPLI